MRLLARAWGPAQLVLVWILSGKTLAHLAHDLRRFIQKAYSYLRTHVFDRLGLGDYFSLRYWKISLACTLFTAWVARRVRQKRIAAAQGEEERVLQEAQQAIEEAEDYKEWHEATLAHQAQMSRMKGDLEQRTLIEREETLYDRDLLAGRLKHLRRQRERGEVGEMVFALRADLLRNLGNMTSPELHDATLARVPGIIQDYSNEVTMQLEYITNYDLPDLPDEEKLSFLQETRHSFGRTALVLSGGGTLGGFHLGVVKVLLEQRCLPRILAGSDVGAIVCAVVGTRTPQQLDELFHKQVHELHSTFFGFGNSEMLRGFLHGGHYKPRVLQAKLRALLGDLTFQEAFDLSGRIVNISVAKGLKGEPPRMLNYLTAPHAVLWSAVAASSAMPVVGSPDLLARSRTGEFVAYEAEGVRRRRWRSGPVEATLTRGMGVLFNVNHFLVSQANPHVAPFLRAKRLVVKKLSLARLAVVAEMEWRHRLGQLQQVCPSWGWLGFVGQQWEGDITMVMPTNWARWMYFFSSPTETEMVEMVRLGERTTWEKISAIKCACGIEITLDECVQSINEKLRHSRQTGLSRSATRGRIPSWNALSALPISRDSSRDSLDREGPGSGTSPTGRGSGGALAAAMGSPRGSGSAPAPPPGSLGSYGASLSAAGGALGSPAGSPTDPLAAPAHGVATGGAGAAGGGGGGGGGGVGAGLAGGWPPEGAGGERGGVPGGAGGPGGGGGIAREIALTSPTRV